MDPPGPLDRVERTFWNVWNYITEAVTRFLRPEETNIGNGDTNQESPAAGEQPDSCTRAESDIRGGREDEEQEALATASVVYSSHAAVAWEPCNTDTDSGPDKENLQCIILLSRGNDGRASAAGEGQRQEQDAQTGHEDTGRLIGKDAGAVEEEFDSDGTRTQELDEHENKNSPNLTEAKSEDIGESVRKAGLEEEIDGAPEDQRGSGAEEIGGKKQKKEEADAGMSDGSDGGQLPASEDANSFESKERPVETGAGEVQERLLPVSEETSDEVARHVELQTSQNKSSVGSDDDVTDVGREQITVNGTERDADNKDEDQEEMEDGSTAVGRERGITTEEKEMLNKTTEQEVDFEAVTEEEDVIIEHTGCSERITQDAETELGRAEFEDDFQTETQTIDEDAVKKTQEVSGISESIHHVLLTDEKAEETVDEKFIGTGKLEEASVSTSCVERACTTSAAITVEPERNNAGEISGGRQNTSIGICGREPDCVTRQETQEGVPECNNGHELDENTAQRFLEVRDHEDIQTTQLPEEVESEEVESKEPESFQHSGSCIEAEDSKLESTEHIEKSFDMVLEEHTGMLGCTDDESPREPEKPLVEPMNGTAAQASGHLFAVEAPVGRLDASVKAEVRRSEELFETDIEKLVETEEEPDHGTEEPLVELDRELSDASMEDGLGTEINIQNERMTVETGEDVDGFSDETWKFSETELLTETRSSDEWTEDVCGTTSLLEEMSECRLTNRSVETAPHLLEGNNVELEDIAVEMQGARVDMEETSCGIEEAAAENESENKNDTKVINLQVMETAAGLRKETDGEEEENALTSGSESSRHTKAESIETIHQLSHKTLETSREETTTDSESSDESMESQPKDAVMIARETEMATGRLAIGHDTDEEILDMWEETVLSDDADDKEAESLIETTKPPEEPEPGPQTWMDVEMHPSDEEQDEEEQTEEEEEEQLVASNAENSEFLDQSQVEWTAPQDGPGSFHGDGEHGGLNSEPAEISDAQNILMKETAESGQSHTEEDQSIYAISEQHRTQTGFLGSPAEVSLNKLSDQSQEKLKSVEDDETGSGKDIDPEVTESESDWNEAEETTVETLTKIKALFNVEERVESEEPESFQHSGSSIEAEDSKLESTEHIEKSFDMVLEGHTGMLGCTDDESPWEPEKPLVEPMNGTAAQASGHLFAVEAPVGRLDASVKAEVRRSEELFETDVEKLVETEEEPDHGTEEPLVELDRELSDASMEDGLGTEINIQNERMTVETGEDVDGFSDETWKFSETELLTETRSSDESTEDVCGTTSLLEEMSECRLTNRSVETAPHLLEGNNVELEDIAVEMQGARVDMEETSCGIEKAAAENESENKNDTKVINLQVMETAAGLRKETDGEEEENALTSGSESSRHTKAESIETIHQLSHKTLETSREETTTDSESSDESMESQPKDAVMIARETEMATGRLAIGHDTDEEILDMWEETVLSDDADDKEAESLIETTKPPEEPEPGPQTWMDVEMQPSDEEQDKEEQTEEEEEEQLVASNAGNSEFLDQSQVEWTAPQDGPGSFHGDGEHGGLNSEPAEISDAQNILMKETAESGQSHTEEGQSIYTISEQNRTQTGFLGSPAEVSLNKLSDQSQEKVKSVEDDETGSRKDIDPEVTESESDWNEAEETTVETLTKIKALFNVEERVETTDESNIPDEMKRADSGPSVITEETGSGPLGETREPEAWSGEGVVPTEGETRSESQDQVYPSPDGSEEIDASSPGLNRDEAAEPRDSLPPWTTSEGQVDAFLLDFAAQRSRIAVKNPRIRPPKDPRTLLHMPSVDPAPSGRLPIKTIGGVPLGGLGIGLKLPGFPAGFPVLKKTQKGVREEKNNESSSQESEAEPEVKDDSPNQEQAEHKRKWTPPRHPGFGNPLMSELKSKLKKTTEE